MWCRRIWLVLASAGLLASAQPGHGQLSKGHQILINRGLQLQGLSQDDVYLHLDTFTNANYTSINWINSISPVHSSRPEWMGAAPGFPWARWASDETQMPPQITPYGGDEAPYLGQILALQLGDEWNLNDDATRTRLVNWFNAVRANWPDTILYHNNWGSQIGDTPLADFYTRAQPDMLCFDTYPWQSVWDVNQPEHLGPPIGGPPTGWYGDLRRYREHARGAGIPLAIYRQTFHAVQDYDQHVFRDPSFSELRLNTFAALAFNARFLTDFVYNTGAASLFTKTFNGSGDTVISTNGLYYEMTDVNQRAINLGKALVRLTPVTTELTPGYTTTMMFIRGKDGSGNSTAVPIGFLATGSPAYTDWQYQRNDPYLTNNWVVTNQGTKNNGQPGDVILAWFKPLDESFDGPDYTNEIYLMVVNGLTATNGTAADCLQEIKLNFRDAFLAVERLNPTNGFVQVQPVPLTNGFRQLVLNLNGGDAALFKFSDGAPFVGAAVVGPPVITSQPKSLTNTFGTIATFSARAAGALPLSYQWRFNGTNISGVTTSSCARTNVQLADVGEYTVVVTNTSGSATSAPATLTVISNLLILYEPFDYTNIGAPVSSNTSANWAYGGTGANDLNVASGSLSYSGLAAAIGNSVTNGGAGLGVRRLFNSSVRSGALFFSALFRINDLGFGAWNGAASQVGALTATDSASFRLAVMVKSNSASGYVIGVQKGGTGATPTFDPAEHPANETILLVGKYDFDASPNAVSLWINPAASTFGAASAPLSGAISATTGTDGFAIDRFNFRQNTAASVPAAMQWDELRIGNSWGDVTPGAAPVRPSLSNFILLNDGRFQFSYTNASGPTGSVYASTNLTDWGALGPATLLVPGVYQFTDPVASNYLRRFYQLRLP